MDRGNVAVGIIIVLVLAGLIIAGLMWRKRAAKLEPPPLSGYGGSSGADILKHPGSGRTGGGTVRPRDDEGPKQT